MATIATTAFAGCNQSAGNQKNSSAPSSSVSEVQQDEESKAESKVESSKDEKSKGESSKKESSKAEVSKAELSGAETSKNEISVQDGSKEDSQLDSSVLESSIVESSMEKSSALSENSDIYTGEIKLDNAIRYGNVISPKMVTKSNGDKVMMAPNSYIAILKEEAEFYIFFICGDYASIPKENVELFPESYSPNFEDGNWFATID